jgi:hypothetical protein
MRIAMRAESTIAAQNATSLKSVSKNCLMPKQTLLHSIFCPTFRKHADVLLLCPHFHRSPGHTVEGGSLAVWLAATPPDGSACRDSPGLRSTGGSACIVRVHGQALSSVGARASAASRATAYDWADTASRDGAGDGAVPFT